ncbi:hypothetical protein PoB_003992000 [Plakobranchus ocellatus]|uniref:Uncharacterized protein n=1 Tax=Plakobranchus ocellatus TaxID=259542 RepID=A0AAV4B1F5_9GAST|nr:hypothetical protein PoB_003992000 [Plakobranchus ocellatus]
MLALYRELWNVGFQSATLTKRGKRISRPGPLLLLYPEQLGISAAKFKDRQALKRFCRPTPEAQQYYNNLASLEETEGSPDVSDEDNA